MPLDLQIGDVLRFKKNHACGSPYWTVLRKGMDFRLRCQGCGHELMMSRVKVEKALREVERDGAQYKPADLIARPPSQREHGS